MPSPTGLTVCDGVTLADGGPAHVFEVQEWGRSARAFVLRFEGRVHGYINRCAHVPVELDWQPGQFFDDSGRWLICAVHGAIYDPGSGVCVGGPCRHKRLKPITVDEIEGRVYWYPSGELTPAAA